MKDLAPCVLLEKIGEKMIFKFLVLLIVVTFTYACTSMKSKQINSYLESTMGKTEMFACESKDYSECLGLITHLDNIESTQQELQMALKYANMVCNADDKKYHATYMGCFAAERIKMGKQIKADASENGYCVEPIVPPNPIPNDWIQMYTKVGC